MSNCAVLVNQVWLEAVMYTAYGDESADENKQRVFAIAGLFGSQTDWADFTEKWNSRTNGVIFHANDCDSDQGDFKSRPHAENKKLYADLANLIANSNLIGLGVSINIKDFDEILAKPYNEHPYYVCFFSVVIWLTKRAHACIPRDKIEFIFDRNPEIEFSAGQLYDRIIRTGPPDFVNLMQDKVSFASSKTTGIQAADLVTRETMKHLDNDIGPVKRNVRGAAKALLASGRIKFEQFTRERCLQAAKDGAVKGYMRADYEEWLRANGLHDSVSNNLRYGQWRRSQELRQS